MIKSDNQNYSIPPGYGFIPTFANGQPNLSEAISIDTPFGMRLAVPIETHPFIDTFLKKTIEAGYMDQNGMWTAKVPKSAWGIWVNIYYETIQLYPDWKFFETKWNTKNLQQNMYKYESAGYDKWHRNFCDVFGIN